MTYFSLDIEPKVHMVLHCGSANCQEETPVPILALQANNAGREMLDTDVYW